MAKMIPDQEGRISCNRNCENNLKEGFVKEEWPLTNNCKSVLFCYYAQNRPYGFHKFQTINSSDGSVNCSFEGELVNKKAEGYGIYKDINGGYEGDWYNDSQTGIGIEQLPDNSNYSGEFKNGVKEGIGIYKWADGTSYAGEWKNNIFNGYGIYKFPNGQIYKGQFISGVMNGYGELIYPNGDAYFGEYIQGKRTGFGLYKVNKNDTYVILYHSFLIKKDATQLNSFIQMKRSVLDKLGNMIEKAWQKFKKNGS